MSKTSSGKKVNSRKGSSVNLSELRKSGGPKVNAKTLEHVETDLKEYERIMEEIYPNFNEEKDFFEKVSNYLPSKQFSQLHSWLSYWQNDTV